MTNFEKITASPEVLGAFLRSMEAVKVPWVDAFDKAFCAKCKQGLAGDCDDITCPHSEEWKNPVDWWLRQDAGEEDTNKAGDRFRITRRSINTPWLTGEYGEYRFSAKVFDEPSKYGIGKGRVSKLEVWKNTEDGERRKAVCLYDRGWAVQPGSQEDLDAVNLIVAQLEVMPREEGNHEGEQRR